MSASAETSSQQVFVSCALEAAIRIGLVFLLVAWCFQIVRPFITPIVWGAIIAVAAYPGYQWLQARLGGRRKLAATLFTLLLLIVVIAPTVMLSGTLVETVKPLAVNLSEGSLTIAPPPETIKSWPVIGETLYDFWTLASHNIEAALQKIGPQIKVVGTWLLTTAAGAGFAILQFVFAIIIAGVLMPQASVLLHYWHPFVTGQTRMHPALSRYEMRLHELR